MSSYEERKQKEEKHEFGFWMFIAGMAFALTFCQGPSETSDKEVKNSQTPEITQEKSNLNE